MNRASAVGGSMGIVGCAGQHRHRDAGGCQDAGVGQARATRHLQQQNGNRQQCNECFEERHFSILAGFRAH